MVTEKKIIFSSHYMYTIKALVPRGYEKKIIFLHNICIKYVKEKFYFILFGTEHSMLPDSALVNLISHFIIINHTELYYS